MGGVVGGLVKASTAPLRFFDVFRSAGAQVSAPPPAPRRESLEVDQAGARELEALRRRRGRRQTILTSGEGVGDEDLLGNIERPAGRGGAMLLGGS